MECSIRERNLDDIYRKTKNIGSVRDGVLMLKIRGIDIITDYEVLKRITEGRQL